MEERLKAKRKLEREIEEEMGDDYVLELKKNYDIDGDQKFDTIPEMWEGHNIADYIDPEIFDVCTLHIRLWPQACATALCFILTPFSLS